MTDDTDDLDEFARMFGANPETPPEGLIPPVPPQPTPPKRGGPAPVPSGDGGADPLAWLGTPSASAPSPAGPLIPPADAPTTAFPANAAEIPTAPMPKGPDAADGAAAGAVGATAAFPPEPTPAVDPFGVAQTTILPAGDPSPDQAPLGRAPLDQASAGSIAAAGTTALPDFATVFPPAPAPEAPTTAFPTRRSAAAASSGSAGGPPDNGRRNVIILGSVGAVLLILIIILVIVIVARSSSTPASAPTTSDAASSMPSTSASATPTVSATPTPTPTVTPTPTPTVTPTPTPPPAPPAPHPTLDTPQVVAPGPVCPADASEGAAVTFTITYSATNATVVTISSDGADGYSASSADANGSFTAKYTCGTPLAEEKYALTAKSAAGGDDVTKVLLVTGTAG